MVGIALLRADFSNIENTMLNIEHRRTYLEAT